MCGIAGWFARDSDTPSPETVVRRMMGALAHRGPDAEGCFAEEGRALGFRRLSIIDLSDLGNQPHENRDGSIVSVVNGEIYNHHELRRDLEARGHQFRSKNDAEVIPYLYEEHGPGFVDHLEGMFALAVLDRRNHRLVLARDRLGKKPLYYMEKDGVLRFASEAKAILAGGDVEAAVDRASIVRFLTFGYVPGPSSALRGMMRLEPGSTLVADRDGHQIERYWTPPEPEPDHTRTPLQWKDDVFAALVSATARRLESDVPLGFFLSGGIDSGLVLAAAREAAPDAKLHAFTVGFDDDSYDERPLAQQTAAHCGVELETMVVSPQATDALDAVASRYDEPFGDASAYPTFLVSQMARRRVGVAISGDGGDESFAGYRRHLALSLASRLDSIMPAAMGRGLARLLGDRANRTGGRSLFGEVRRFLGAMGVPANERTLFWCTFFRAPLRTRFLHPDLLDAAGVNPEEEVEDLLKSGGGSPLRQAMRFDLLRYLPDDLLVKTDIASMSCGLEVRSPMLDHHVVELATKIPDSLLSHGFETKVLLRELARDRLPADVAGAPKRGFGVPMARWLRGPLRHLLDERLLSETFRQRGILKDGAARELIARHQSGAQDWSDYLWALLVLDAWYRRFIDGEKADS